MTIFDDRLRSPKHLAFFEKLTSRHWWTADDYWDVPDELVVEIYDGGIHVVPSASPDHQFVAGDIYLALRAAIPEKRRVIMDVDVNVLGKIYKPDVLVVKEPTNLQPIPGDLLQVVVEVISQNENIERTAKKAAYAAQGIPLYIVVDGKQGTHFAEIYRLNGAEYERQATVSADAKTEFAEPFPFVLDMKQINS
ncbi:MAG: Uma2 family endonuclease [Hamadaea sp.]|nr:Uma2 family endonuclease [Hamadaea sp.]